MNEQGLHGGEVVAFLHGFNQLTVHGARSKHVECLTHPLNTFLSKGALTLANKNDVPLFTHDVP